MVLTPDQLRDLLQRVDLKSRWGFYYEFNQLLRANDSLVCHVRYELRLHEPEEHGSLVSVPNWLDYRSKEVQFFDTIHDTEVTKRRFRDHCLAVLKQQELENARLQNPQAHGGTP